MLLKNVVQSYQIQFHTFINVKHSQVGNSYYSKPHCCLSLGHEAFSHVPRFNRMESFLGYPCLIRIIPLQWNQNRLLKQSHPTQFRPCKWQAIISRLLIVACLSSNTKPSPIYQDSTKIQIQRRGAPHLESIWGYLSGLPKNTSTGSQESYAIVSNTRNFGGHKRKKKLRMKMFTTK